MRFWWKSTSGSRPLTRVYIAVTGTNVTVSDGPNGTAHTSPPPFPRKVPPRELLLWQIVTDNNTDMIIRPRDPASKNPFTEWCGIPVFDFEKSFPVTTNEPVLGVSRMGAKSKRCVLVVETPAAKAGGRPQLEIDIFP